MGTQEFARNAYKIFKKSLDNCTQCVYNKDSERPRTNTWRQQL
nr:MAG TPA: hypothetical protein [Caudoviricetes sp.]